MVTTKASVPHWIDNAPYVSSSTSPLTHPNTGAHVHDVGAATAQDVDKAIASAQAAFPAWAATSAQERRRILLKVGELLRAQADDFHESWKNEMTSEAVFSKINVAVSAEMIEEVAANITLALQGDIPQPANAKSVLTIVTREPYGVCLALCPFNAALILSIRGIIAALATGNTVVAKTSELVPYTQYLWGPLFAKAGLPSGCLNILHVSRNDAPEITKLMIEDRRIRHVSFTGSSNVGRHIGRMAGANLKPCILELGGKSPVLVLSDAQIEIAANNVLFHMERNNGQICMSTERVIVSPKVHAEFVASIQKQHIKKNCKVASGIGASRIKSMVQDAVSEGASIIAGGDLWPPTDEAAAKGELPSIILDGVTPQMKIWKEETFGPVSVILSPSFITKETEAAEIDAIVALANDSDYGLTASVFTADVAKALLIARRLENGLVRINSGTVGDEPTIPFGGVKDTGFGRFNGLEALRAFTQTKAVSIALSGPSMLPL